MLPLKLAKNIKEINWSPNLSGEAGGGFGLPWNYEADLKVVELNRKVKAGEPISDSEFAEVEGWLKLKLGVADVQERDRISFGWRLRGWESIYEHWNDADIHLICGGNRAGKTDGGCGIDMYAGLCIPEADIFIFHVDDDTSVKIGQKKMYDLLPMEYGGVDLKAAAKQKGQFSSMTWTQKNGFSDGKLILPPMDSLALRGSEFNFFTYAQYYNDSQKFEGLEGDLIHFDEEVPLALYKTALLRRKKHNPKKIMITATLINGQTELVAFLLDKPVTLKERMSTYLNKKLPVLQRSTTQPNCLIHYLWTEDNPFNDWEGTKADLQAFSFEEKMTRACGVPKRASLGKFPLFDPKVHVVEPGKIPEHEATNYQIIDPAGEKPWFMLWVRVDKKGDFWVYREWPDMESYGPWAMPASGGMSASNRFRGSPGPAQQETGFGYDGYARLIRSLESGEPIAERLMDSRFANKGITQDEGSTTTIEEMSRHGLFFTPTRGDNNIRPGLLAINSLFEYDRLSPIDDFNRPKLHISSECGNLINCIQNFTGLGGQEEHYKDPLDCLRYAVMSDLVHWGMFPNKKGGHW